MAAPTSPSSCRILPMVFCRWGSMLLLSVSTGCYKAEGDYSTNTGVTHRLGSPGWLTQPDHAYPVTISTLTSPHLSGLCTLAASHLYHISSSSHNHQHTFSDSLLSHGSSHIITTDIEPCTSLQNSQCMTSTSSILMVSLQS